jgi:hypothetical protein
MDGLLCDWSLSHWSVEGSWRKLHGWLRVTERFSATPKLWRGKLVR